MEVSLFLAKLIGFFLLILGITLFLRASDLKGMAKDFAKSPVLQMFIGAFHVLFGLLLVLIHNEWGTYAQSLISVFGWITLVKGALLLWSPELVHDVLDPVAGEQAHEIVLAGEVEARLARIALAA